MEFIEEEKQTTDFDEGLRKARQAHLDYEKEEAKEKKKLKGKPKEVTTHIYRALKLSLWTTNLSEAIKNSTKNISQLSEEGNFVRFHIDKYTVEPKYAFQKKTKYKGKNTLKRFLNESYLNILDTGQRENLCRMLEIWEFSQGRDKDGNGKGYEMSGRADSEYLFPTKNVVYFCIKNGWIREVIKKDIYGAKLKMLFLTEAGSSLPKVKTALKLKDQTGIYKPTGLQSSTAWWSSSI